MRFNRARYVTVCQQSLVTAAVLAVGVSAAGVKTLDIVPQPSQLADQRGAGSAVVPQQTDDRPQAGSTKVDVAPVTPKVREVAVTGIETGPEGARTPAPTAPTQDTAPRQAQGKAQEEAGDRATTKVAGKRLVALSEPQPVRGYATVGVTWKQGARYDDEQIAVQVRTEKNGTWSAWMPAEYHDEHGPDAGEEGGRPGTDALVIGDVDRVQMRAETLDGSTPPDLKLAVIDPGTGTMATQKPAIDTAANASASPSATTADQASLSAYTSDPVDPAAPVDPAVTDGTSGTGDTAALTAMKRAPKPYIYSRAQWGANEKLRDQSLPAYGTIKAAFIHHTVNANSYTADQVPSLLRGIYAYHTQSRGWRDIGYNFLVDRFGRIWEGRWGGVDRAVVGAHTLGYNEVAFAMSAIGNFDVANPPQAVSDAYARLFAWKLSMYNIRADAMHIYVKNRYMNAINGHRDVGQTACPGRYLYAKIPAIRTATQAIENKAQSGTATPAPTPTPAPAPDPNAFTSPTQTPKAATTQPAGLTFPTTLNLAGDSRPDLVLKSTSGVVSVLQTGGLTGFAAPVETAGNWTAFNLATGVGDLTGDGRGDVLGRAKGGSARVYPGDGAGHVSTTGGPATLAFRWANMVFGAGDWNRDGRRDVLMRDTSSGRLWLVTGAGGGRFGKLQLVSGSFGGFVSAAVAGDMNGDGRPDLVGIHRNGYVYVAMNTARGTLGAFQRRQHVGTAYDTVAGGAADLTGDSFGDVVLRSSRSGQVIILPSKQNGWFGTALGPFEAAPGLGRLSAGQMAGSGQPDLVALSTDGTRLVVVPHNGQTNLRGLLPSNLTRADATQVLNVGDWNGDGRGDVITRQTSGDALVLRPGLGDGRFGAGRLMSYGWKSFGTLSAVGDVTGDGKPDLVGRRDAGSTVIFPGNGAAGFTAPVTAGNYLKTFNLIGAGSWKPQYLPGSAYRSADGAIVPFRGTGVGTIPGYDWVLGPGDVDGDGKQDLVTRDGIGRLWLLPGTDAGYAQRRLLGEGFGGYSLGG